MRNSTRFWAHALGCKRDAHHSLAHDIEVTATPQSRRHMPTLRDDHAQSTKRLKTSDFRAPCRHADHPEGTYLTASIFLSHRIHPQLRLTLFRHIGHMRNKWCRVKMRGRKMSLQTCWRTVSPSSKPKSKLYVATACLLKIMTFSGKRKLVSSCAFFVRYVETSCATYPKERRPHLRRCDAGGSLPAAV